MSNSNQNSEEELRKKVSQMAISWFYEPVLYVEDEIMALISSHVEKAIKERGFISHGGHKMHTEVEVEKLLIAARLDEARISELTKDTKG